MIDRNRRFRLIVAIGLAGLVAAREVIFLLEHPFRSGPAVEIVVLAAAVVLLGLERLKDPQ